MGIQQYPATQKIATEPYLNGFKNPIRNGDMGVAQRGNGNWTTNGYGVDGYALSSSGGTFTVSRVATPVGSGMGVNGAAYFLRGVVAGQSAAGDYAKHDIKIEDVRTLAGKEVTLSFVAVASTGTPKIGVEVEQYFGVGGSPSATVQAAISAITISTTATRYTVTFTVPSISGKVFGTDATNRLVVGLWLSAGSSYNTRASSIGIQNTTIDITDVQLEQGSVATPFERLPQQMQLAWCQRYLRVPSGLSTILNSNVVGGVGATANGTTCVYVLEVSMRAVPTLIGSGSFNNNDGATSFAVTALTVESASTPGIIQLNATSGGGGMTTGRASRLLAAAAGNQLILSSEL